MEPPAPSVSAAINAQLCSRFFLFQSLFLGGGAGPLVSASPPRPPPCLLLGIGLAYELNMAELVGTLHAWAGVRGRQGQSCKQGVCPVPLPCPGSAVSSWPLCPVPWH